MHPLTKGIMAVAIKNIACELHVQPRYFNLILSGQKTVEGRIAREKYCALKPGDWIRFMTEESGSDPSRKTLREFDAKVVGLGRFASFSEMLSFYGLRHCLPGIRTLEEGVSIYHGFPAYEDDAKRLGTIGIEIEPEHVL